MTAIYIEQSATPESITLTVGGSTIVFADILSCTAKHGPTLIEYISGEAQAPVFLAGDEDGYITFETTDIAKAIALKEPGATVTSLSAKFNASTPADSGVTAIAKHLYFTMSVGAVDPIEHDAKTGGNPNSIPITIRVANNPADGTDGTTDITWAT